MKDKILQKSTRMFSNLGFKSVTMDDIANEMGISKKTIYQHFENKTKLVEATAIYVFGNISEGIDCIFQLNKNPIQELYEIKRFVINNLKDEKSSPQYQLQKYYPKIFSNLKRKQFNKMLSCVSRNIERGISKGFYRENLDINFIARIYFSGILSLKDREIFPNETFAMQMLMDNYLEYHLRGICSTKGLKELETITKSDNYQN